MIRRIRSAIFAAFLILLIAVMGVVCLPIILFGRTAARGVVKLWAQITLVALKAIAGVSYRVEGAENMPQSGALIASNHQSMWETVAFYALVPKPVMILKKELLNVPVYGWWARAAGNIAIDRNGGARALRAMMRAAKDRIDAGEQIVIFPEGTRSAPGARAPLQPGVAGIYTATGAPCVPAAHDSGRFWRHPAMEKIPGTVTLRLLPPIKPGLDRKTFLRTLAAQIEHARPDIEPAGARKAQ